MEIQRRILMARKCIEKYLETHKSNYIGKYRCHSAVQTKKFDIISLLYFRHFNLKPLMFLSQLITQEKKLFQHFL